MSNLVMPSLAGLDVKVDRVPVTATNVQEGLSGKEVRSTWWTYPRTRFMVSFNVLRSDSSLASPRAREWQQLFGHFARHFGSLDSFLFTDPTDFQVTDHCFAVGDGVKTTFQLQRTLQGDFTDASGFRYTQQTKPYTNQLTGASFETDANADGLADDWLDYNNSAALEPTTHVIIPGMNGGKAQRTSWGTNNTTTKGVRQAAWQPIAGQWYTVSLFARASGTNVGKFIGMGWNSPNPSQTLVINDLPLTTSWQRYVFQIFWNVGLVPGAGLFLSINGAANGTTGNPSATFGDLDFDLTQIAVGQWALHDLQPIETPAGAAATDNPALWPQVTDGFEPIFDVNGDVTVYQDGDWPGRRTLLPYARTNLINNSEQVDLWTLLNATVTANTSVAPDGTTTADTFNEGTAVTVQHRVNTSGSPADIVGELRCWSVFVKAGNLPNINIGAPGAFSSAFVNFNLGTGVIDSVSGGVLASGVQTSPLWPGWSRVWFIRRGSVSGTALFVSGCLDNTYSSAGYTGTSRTFLIWGAMCERTSNLNGPTPYIKTPGAANVTVTDYTIGTTGVVTPTPVLPAAAFLSADMFYYRRVRSAKDELSSSQLAAAMWESKSWELISVKL